MLAYNVSTDDIVTVLEEQNIEASPGKIGENSEKGDSKMQFVLRYSGRHNAIEDYENLIIKSTEEGQILRFKDVADIEFGTEYFDDDNLLELIDTALANNYQLQQTLQKIKIAKANYNYSSGQLYPQIYGEVSAGLNHYAEDTPDYLGNTTTEYDSGFLSNPIQEYFVGVTSYWELDIWGKLSSQKKGALSHYLATVEGKNFVISNLISEVALHYYELIALDNELEIIRETIESHSETLKLARLQKEIGSSNEVEIKQFQVELLNTKSIELEIELKIKTVENRLNFLLGTTPRSIERSKEKLYEKVPNQIAVGIPFELLANRPDIRQAKLKVEATKYNLEAAKAAFYPDINITAAVGASAMNPELLISGPAAIGYSILGGITAPLINRTFLNSEFDVAKAEQELLLNNYQETILNAYYEVHTELNIIQKLESIILIKNEQGNELDSLVNSITNFYMLAKANYFELLNARQNLLNTKLDIIDINKRKFMSIIKLYKALGGGWRTD